MNVAIVGSRDFADQRLIVATVIHLRSTHDNLCIVSGGARGVDSMAESAARGCNVPTIVYKPDWDGLGKGAGYIRNRLIVADADMLVAFFAPGPRSRGTAHSVALALAKGITVHVYHEGRWSTS